MCGVSFIWSESTSNTLLASRMEASLVKISHRGPDASRCKPLRHGFIGHTRLSIIDLEASQQPLLRPCAPVSYINLTPPTNRNV